MRGRCGSSGRLRRGGRASPVRVCSSDAAARRRTLPQPVRQVGSLGGWPRPFVRGPGGAAAGVRADPRAYHRRYVGVHLLARLLADVAHAGQDPEALPRRRVARALGGRGRPLARLGRGPPSQAKARRHDRRLDLRRRGAGGRRPVLGGGGRARSSRSGGRRRGGRCRVQPRFRCSHRADRRSRPFPGGGGQERRGDPWRGLLLARPWGGLPRRRGPRRRPLRALCREHATRSA